MTPRRIIVDGTQDGSHQLVIIDGLELRLSPNRYHVFETLALARYLDQDNGWLDRYEVWFTPEHACKLLYQLRRAIQKHPPLRHWQVYETNLSQKLYRLDAKRGAVSF